MSTETASQLKSSVFLVVSKIVEEEVARGEIGAVPSPMFVATLVDLVFNQLINMGEDLESFAHHAGRKVIKPADVYMIVRKNESLTQVLKQYESQHNT